MRKPRRRVGRMAVNVRTETTTEEKLRARAIELSEKLTKSTMAAGITQEQLQKDAYRAFLNVKRTRRFGRN